MYAVLYGQLASRRWGILLLLYHRLHHDSVNEHVLPIVREYDQDNRASPCAQLNNFALFGPLHWICDPGQIHARVRVALVSIMIILTQARWASWIRWINPVSYGFESVMVNEFHDRQFPCASFVPSGPGYESIAADQRACAVQGSKPGLNFVGGTSYVETAFSYQWNNRWRNFGIIVAMTTFLFIAHLVMTELVASERSKGEVLVFRRSKMAKKHQRRSDEETGSNSARYGEKFANSGTSTPSVQKQQSVFHWEGVNYEVQIKGETRKILDLVDGWIKPGTLTALMVSGSQQRTTNFLNLLGCIRRRQDYLTRCPRKPNHYGHHFR